MKNLLLIVFLAGLFVTGCKIKDKQPPVIIINGDNPMTVTLGTMWTDPGATADDNVDGSSLTNSIEVTHNINIYGPANGNGITKYADTCAVTYTVKDIAGNVGTATRTVYVKNSAEKYATTYTQTVNAGNEYIVKDTTVPTAVNLTYDNRINNRIYFPKLGYYINTQHNTIKVYGDIIGNDTINVPAQYFAFWEGTTRCLYIVSGVLNESIILDAIDYNIKVTYQINELYYDQTLGTVSWNDSLWEVIHNDEVVDTYVRY